MNLLLTGATGFLGQKLSKALLSLEHIKLTTAGRRASGLSSVRDVCVDDIDATTDWSLALKGQQVVIHAAARAHVMNETAEDPLDVYRRVNCEGTLNLARQAAAEGIKRFVFISTIKVNGSETPIGQPFTADQSVNPQDPYAVSKWEAEQGLNVLSAETGLEVVIIRPPMIYGPGVKGNFVRLIALVEKGIPLPFGAIHNQRSLVSVDNLVDLIQLCIHHPAAANQVFLASDGQDLSTTELLQFVAAGIGKSAHLIPVPSSFLQWACVLLHKENEAHRLLKSLQIDISKNREVLGWEPPVSVDEGFKRCFR